MQDSTALFLPRRMEDVQSYLRDGYLATKMERSLQVHTQWLDVFNFRDPVECALSLPRQCPYNNHMIQGATWTVEAEGDRVYSEMNSADWSWWETQDRLPLGATIVPLICGLDETQLTDLSGDRKAWSIILTCGNIHSSLRNTCSYITWIVLAIVPVQPNFQPNSASGDWAQRDINQQVWSDIAKIVLEPVTRFPEGGDMDSSALCPCSDSNQSHCWPIVASWQADHMEHADLMSIQYNACPKCQTPKDELQSLIIPLDLEFHQQQSAVFQQKFWEYQNAKTANNCQAIKNTEDWFQSLSVRPVTCIFWDHPHVEANKPHQPDILNIIFIGLFDLLLTWMQGFLQRHGKAAVFGEIWAAIPPYPSLYHYGKSLPANCALEW